MSMSLLSEPNHKNDTGRVSIYTGLLKSISVLVIHPKPSAMIELQFLCTLNYGNAGHVSETHYAMDDNPTHTLKSSKTTTGRAEEKETWELV